MIDFNIFTLAAEHELNAAPRLKGSTIEAQSLGVEGLKHS